MTLADYRKERGEPLAEAPAPGHEEHHPTAWQYLQIGLILAVITAVEVALYYIDMSHDLLVALLVALSVAKFSLVVLWFMHLRFDNRLFSTLFMVGLGATAVLFTIVIAIEGGSLV
jgi:cytochrome c oxidase subunit 4